MFLTTSSNFTKFMIIIMQQPSWLVSFPTKLKRFIKSYDPFVSQKIK